MKKILLVVGYKTINYGSLLQSYATQKMFEKAGVLVKILNLEVLWAATRKKRVFFYIKNGEIKNLIIRKGGVYFSEVIKKFDRAYRNGLRQREKKFISYIKDNLLLSGEVKDWNEASKVAEDFEGVVIGSDQVWLPSSVVTDIYTLAFANNGQVKIAYAPSFGLSNIPKKYWKKYREMLESFQFLSVREESGVRIVKEIAKLNCEIVIDPVYMFDKNEWKDKIPDKKMFDKPYIFVYLLGNNRWQRDIIMQFASYYKIKTVALIHLDQYIGYDESYFDIKIIDASPEDFLNLIRHAELIFTDSFHCASFSIIENKDFFVFKRYKENSKGSTNSRMDSLFKLLNIDKDRMITKSSDFNDIANRRKIDYVEVNNMVKNVKKQSWEYIKKAVE